MILVKSGRIFLRFVYAKPFFPTLRLAWPLVFNPTRAPGKPTDRLAPDFDTVNLKGPKDHPSLTDQRILYPVCVD